MKYELTENDVMVAMSYVDDETTFEDAVLMLYRDGLLDWQQEEVSDVDQ